jgi:hypothetical protein
MKPDTTHAQYEEFKDVWAMCRDCSTGQRAVHNGGTTYLPKLSGQTDEAYNAYKKRALFFNATGRTVEGMRGLIFRKKGKLETPKAMDEWLEDITMTGISFEGLTKKSTEDVIKVGRYGLLVDMPMKPVLQEGAALTKADAQKLNMRPFAVSYTAESILNWENRYVGSKTVLMNVFLDEPLDQTNSGLYDKKVRQLTMQSGFYQQIIWLRLKNATNRTAQSDWIAEAPITPEMNARPLDFIPFWFFAPEETIGEVQAPPIEDLCYVNLSHYQNSADLENGLHISGLPTPYLTGVEAEEAGKLHLGSNNAWGLSNTDSKVGYLQVGADGFTSLEKGMDRKENQMAALGARMIAPEKKGVEAAETANIRRGGENSVLADIAGTIEKTFQQVLEFMAEWGGLSGTVTYELNKNFLPIPMDASALTAWVKAWQAASISDKTFFDALQAGEAIAENVSFEDEQDRKKESQAPLGSDDDGE